MQNEAFHPSIEDQIADQAAREGEFQTKPIPPLKYPVIAKQHTAVYKMHRYFARRPWNVFEHIIKHYTNPGDTILDPFCGGGVTVYEGLKLKRRVIGIDLNPLAAWITKMQVQPIDLQAVEEAFERVVDLFAPIAKELYSTKCGSCGEEAIADWFEWSNVLICPGCGDKVVLATARKLRAGVYECTNDKCLSVLAAKNCLRAGDVLVNKMMKCRNCEGGIFPVDEDDIAYAKEIAGRFDKIVKKEKLFIPQVPFPDGDLEKDHSLFKKGIISFKDLFTARNLISLGRLKNIIAGLDVNDDVREALWFIFSAAIRYVNKMTFRSEVWRGDKPFEWAAHAYWLPISYLEPNISLHLLNRKNAFIRGKEQSQEDIGGFARIHPDSYHTCRILTQSSEETDIPYKSVDCVITDPPFGGNVQYAELTDFWVVWLPEIFGLDGVIDNSREAIETRHKGFPTEKGRDHYEDMLYKIFKECYRVLKDDGYMVMTFHNKDVGVWMALHRAARRAGFVLPERVEVDNHGMIYQDFIKNYQQTFHTRAPGSLLGDFILTFKKADVPEFVDGIIYELSITQQKELLSKLEETIKYHCGLDNNSMGILVVEILADMNLLHRFAGSDLSGFYKDHFVYVKADKKWYMREMVDPANGPVKMMEILPVERAVERLLYSYFQEHSTAALDELLFFIFTKLVNSKRPSEEAVKRTISRCCIKESRGKRKRDIYMWKRVVEKPIEVNNNQIEIFEGEVVDHNRIIEKLARGFIKEGYRVRIGDTEVRKDAELREISTKYEGMDLGIPPDDFRILKEIDLLVIKGNKIYNAIEVVTTFSTFNNAVNDRFRNLLAVIPNYKFGLEVYVCKSFIEKASKVLNSTANVKIGLNKMITLSSIESC